MRNRFNLNESEKNRIRTLHGIKVIKEQREFMLWSVNNQLYGTGEPGKTTQGFMDELKVTAAEELENSGLKGQTVNLYKNAGKEDAQGRGEKGSHKESEEGIGNYKISAIILTEDALEVLKSSYDGAGWAVGPILIKFELIKEIDEENPTHTWGDFIITDWSCGQGYFRVLDTGSDKLGLNNVMNDKLARTLDQTLCRGSIKSYTTMKYAIDNDTGGVDTWQIVEPADFAMGDEGATGETPA